MTRAMAEKIVNSEIKRAELKDKETLKNLMQFYFYDFSEFVEAYVENDGHFSAYTYLDSYWEEESRYPYLIKINGKLAGFALVRKVQGEINWSIAEFFIMKKFRRSGLGSMVAHQIFDRHRGNWEVHQIEMNKPAQSFWRKVISDYTGDNYLESMDEGRVIQTFSS